MANNIPHQFHAKQNRSLKGTRANATLTRISIGKKSIVKVTPGHILSRSEWIGRKGIGVRNGSHYANPTAAVRAERYGFAPVANAVEHAPVYDSCPINRGWVGDACAVREFAGVGFGDTVTTPVASRRDRGAACAASKVIPVTVVGRVESTKQDSGMARKSCGAAAHGFTNHVEEPMSILSLVSNGETHAQVLAHAKSPVSDSVKGYVLFAVSYKSNADGTSSESVNTNLPSWTPFGGVRDEQYDYRRGGNRPQFRSTKEGSELVMFYPAAAHVVGSKCTALQKLQWWMPVGGQWEVDRTKNLSPRFITVGEEGQSDYDRKTSKTELAEYVRRDVHDTIVQGGSITADDANFYGMSVESTGLNNFAPYEANRGRKMLYVLGAVTHRSPERNGMVELHMSEMFVLGVDEEDIFGQTPSPLWHESGVSARDWIGPENNCYIKQSELPLSFDISEMETAAAPVFFTPEEEADEAIVIPVDNDAAPVVAQPAGPVSDRVARSASIREALAEFHRNSHPMTHVKDRADLWAYDAFNDNRPGPRTLYRSLGIAELFDGLFDEQAFVDSFVTRNNAGSSSLSRNNNSVRSNSSKLSGITWTWIAYAIAKTGGVKINRPVPGRFSFTAVEDGVPGVELLKHTANTKFMAAKVNAKSPANDNVRRAIRSDINTFEEFEKHVASHFDEGIPVQDARVAAFLLLSGNTDYVLVGSGLMREIERVLELYDAEEHLLRLWVVERSWMQWYRRAWRVEDVKFLVDVIAARVSPEVMSWEDIRQGEHARIHFGNAKGAAGQWLEVKTDRASGETWVEDGRGRLLLNTVQINPVPSGYTTEMEDLTPTDSLSTLFMIFIESFIPMLTVMGSTTVAARIGLNLYEGLMKTEDYYKFSENQFDSNNEANKWWELAKFQMVFKKAWLPFVVKNDKLVLAHVPNGANGIKTFLAQQYTFNEGFGRNDIINTAMQQIIERYNFGYNFKSDVLMRGDVLHTRWEHLPASVRVEWAKKHLERIGADLKWHSDFRSADMPEIDLSSEAYWNAVASKLVSTHSSKAAKASKRVELPHADGVPNENAKRAGWLLPGMKRQLEGVQRRCAIMLSTVMAPGLNVSIPDAHGNHLSVVGLNKSWTSSEYESKGERNCVTLANDSWAVEETHDREWVKFTLGGGHGVSVEQDEVIAYVNGHPVKNRMQGSLATMQWRLANTHSGPRVHIEWVIVSREDAMKGRSTFKAQYVYGSRSMLYNGLNIDTIEEHNLDVQIDSIMTSDSAKWDVVYSMLMVAGPTFANSNVAEYHRLLREANAIAEGREHSEYLYIEPTLVHIGVYDEIREVFHRDFAKTLWLEYADSEFQAQPLYLMKLEDAAAGTWQHGGDGCEDAVRRALEMGAVKTAVFSNAEQRVVFGLNANGVAVNYLHRSVGYVGTQSTPVLNIEIFERTTVLQSAGTTRQMSQNIRALLRMMDRNDPEVRAELLSMIDDGDLARYQYEIMSLMNAGVDFSEQLGLDSILNVADANDRQTMKQMMLDGGIDVYTTNLEDHEEMFRRFCKVFKDTLLCLPNKDGKGKKFYWMPALLSYTSLKTNKIDDSTVASLMKQMLINIGRSASITNYPNRINGMMKAFTEDNKNLKKFLRGRKCMQAKRVSLPCVPHGEAWIKYSSHPNSPYQLWVKVLAENGIPMATNANGTKAPLDGWVAQSIRSPIPEGPIVRVRILQENDPRLAVWDFHWAQIALNTIDTYIDAGDYDGDGNFLVPMKNQALAKYCTTQDSVRERLSARLGYDMYSADSEAYARDHLAIKTWKGVEKKAYAASSKVAQNIASYVQFSRNSRDLQKVAVGSSYSLWNLPEVIHEIVMVMKRANVEVPFCLNSLIDECGHMIGRGTEIYEVYLGGFDPAAFEVYQKITEATNTANPNPAKPWEALPCANRMDGGHDGDEHDKLGQWQKQLDAMGANGSTESALQLGAMFNIAALINSVERYRGKGGTGAGKDIFGQAATKWWQWSGGKTTPMTDAEREDMMFLFATAMLSFQVGRAQFEGFAKLRPIQPKAVNYDEFDMDFDVSDMYEQTKVEGTPKEQTHRMAMQIVREGLERHDNLIEMSTVLYQLSRTFDMIGGVLEGERAITDPDAVYDVFTSGLDKVELKPQITDQVNTIAADEECEFVMYDDEAAMPEYEDIDDGYDAYLDMPQSGDVMDDVAIPAMDDDFDMSMDMPAPIEDNAPDEEFVAFDATELETVEGLVVPEDLPAVPEAIEIPAPTPEVTNTVEIEEPMPTVVDNTADVAVVEPDAFVTPVEESLAEETARLEAEAAAVLAEAEAIKQRIASVKAARAKRDKAAAALEAARQAKAAAEAELAALLADEPGPAAPVVQEPVAVEPTVEPVAPVVEEEEPAAPTPKQRNRASKKLGGTRKSRRDAKKAARAAKETAAKHVEAIKSNEPVKVDADSFFTPMEEETDDSFDFAPVELDDEFFGGDWS